eukprot:3117069-Amphidinium_carterae.1
MLMDVTELPHFHRPPQRRKERWQLPRPCYDPYTNGDCLFMCMSYELSRLGVQISSRNLRTRVQRIWQEGWTYLEADAELWAHAAGKKHDDFMRTTTSTRWGMAADAGALARSFRLNVNIYGKTGSLFVKDKTFVGCSTVHLRLAHQHYTVIDGSHTFVHEGDDDHSFYLFREARGSSGLRELISLRRYLASKGIYPCNCAPATKIREDPQGHPTGPNRGREASKQEDPDGQAEDPRWTSVWGGMILTVFGRLVLLPGRARLQDGPGLAWIGGISSCCSSLSLPSSLSMCHVGGMPTKVVPVQQQPEPLSEDERFEFQGLWIALKRVNMRVHWSLNSPVDAILPPGAMARVIGPTRLVAPVKTRDQHQPRAQNIVRANVELAAPWRRGNCGDFGY